MNDIADLSKKIIIYADKWGRFLLRNGCFNLSERFRVIASLDRDKVIRSLIRKRLAGPDNESKFFSICGFVIYFVPGYETSDEEYFMKGITSVLIDTFILPEHFNSEVYVKEGDVVFDLGGNIGTSALLFARMAGEKGRVFSFEPVTHSVLSLNVKKNNMKNIEVIPEGISDQAGEGEMEMSDYCLDSSMAKRKYTEGYYRHTRTIRLTSLDIFAEKKNLNKMDFIKVDIEGMEELAIRGAEKVIDKYRPKWSISSYHIDFNNEPQHNKLLKLLKAKGYKTEEKGSYHIYAW